MLRFPITGRTGTVLVAVLGAALAATTLSVPAAFATSTTEPGVGGADPAPIGRISAHGSAAAPGQASVTVQLTADRPAVITALAGERRPARTARRAALLAAAPSAATSDAAARFLTRSGLTVTGRTAFSVTASGPRALVSSLFPAASAPRTGRARTAASAASPLVVPAGLAGLVSYAVGGADTRRVAYPRFVRATAAATPAFTASPITGATARTLYGVPAAATTAPGQGITVATLQFSGWDPRNLTSFAALNHLPNPVSSGQYQAVSVDGASPTTPDGDGGDVEVALDQEALLTTAPHANQVAYFAPNSAQGFVDGFNAVASDALVGRAGHLFTALSVSWGQCEPGWDPGAMKAIDAAIQNVVAAGVTVFAASGDSGAYDCSTTNAPDNRLTVDFPASDPFVIGVGGLTTDAAARQERVWWSAQGPAPGYLGSGGGGGQSGFWPAPSWQVPLLAGPHLRLVPDISLDADPSSGLNIVAQGGSMLVGGTSLAAPLAAATLTDLQIATGASQSYGLGSIAGSLYAAPPTSLRDTTVGSNGYYQAKAGFDLASGLGAPLWSSLRGSVYPAPAARSQYHPSDPLCRLVDTRTGTSTCAGATRVARAAIGAGRALRVQVRGVGGVPDTATAVVLNLTATGASTPTYVTAWPAGTPRPGVSTLNATPGGAAPNLAVVGVGSDGAVGLYNAQGQVQLVADLVGWYAPDVGASYTTTGPCRVLDTRSGKGTCPDSATVVPAPLGPGQTLRVPIAGVAGIPATATAVVLNLTAVGATTATWLTAWADGTPRPLVSNLNPAPGQGPSPNLAVVPVDPANGSIDIYNAFGNVDVVVDLAGYFAPDAGASYTTTGPCRVLDTRSGKGTCPAGPTMAKAPLGAGQTLRVPIAGVAGIPATATAVVLNLTAVGATTATWLTAWADGTPRPLVSNLNPAPGQGPSPNLAVVPVDPANGRIDIYNAFGRVDVVIDVVGYFAPN